MVKKVLIVDDEESILVSIVLGLEKKGYEVDATLSSIKAFLMLQFNQYDLLISDIKMDGLNGYELARACFRISPHTRVIFMSGFDFPEGSFYDVPCLTKPFKFSELMTEINKVAAL
jgi:two-component system cell cycle response regulator CpdR